MTHIGVLGVTGLVLIMIALGVWLFMTMRASRNPAQNRDDGGKLKRGPVSGGVIHGDPGQSMLTGEAPRQDEQPEKD
jgi:hypothetical protein